MASITIRNLDDTVKQRLRERAAVHGRSMEEEARQILQGSLVPANDDSDNLFVAIRKIVDPIGGIEIELPARTSRREPPAFE